MPTTRQLLALKEKKVRTMYPTKILAIVLTTILLSCSSATAQIVNPVREVQIRTVDLVNQTVEVHNFGTTDQPLDGWRFCTHNESAERRYSSSAALNGVVLAAGESMFLMYNNDASAANQFNISSLGNFATPLDAEGAYAIQFYINSSFGSATSIADHLQFSADGLDDSRADARSATAEGSVWSDQNAWISVSDSTTSISLNAGAEDSELHGPSDFTVTGEAVLLGDVNLDRVVDFNDIPLFVNALLMGMFQLEADTDGNGVVDFNDIPGFVTILLG